MDRSLHVWSAVMSGLGRAGIKGCMRHELETGIFLVSSPYFMKAKAVSIDLSSEGLAAPAAPACQPARFPAEDAKCTACGQRATKETRH